MAVRYIDLAIALENGLPSDPEMMIPRINYVDHRAGAEQMKDFFPGVKKEDLPDGLGWALERLSLTTHSGTHLDAPFHYHPRMDQGKPALTIDQVPLEWCFSDGVVLDFIHKRKGDNITEHEVRTALDGIGYTLKPLDIVLIRTDVYKHAGEPEFASLHPGVSREATLWLIEQGIKVMGIDAWGWDRSLGHMISDLKAGHSDQFWESHYLGWEREYCHLERLAHLDRIPVPHGFKVAVFPIKIENASAGWVRAVAILD